MLIEYLLIEISLTSLVMHFKFDQMFITVVDIIKQCFDLSAYIFLRGAHELIS